MAGRTVSSSALGIAVAGAIALGFALAVPACSLTSALDGLSSGGSPPPVEAGAGLDAAPTDADVVVDAGAEAAQPFRCEGRAAVFCADFELVPWPAPFDQPSPDTAKAEVIEGAGLSGRGVVTRTPERSVSGRAGPAVVEAQTSMGVKQAFTVSYDVKVDRVSGAGNVLLTLFYTYAPFYIATLRVENDGRCFLDEYGDGTATLPSLSLQHELAVNLAAETWTHVVLSVKFDGGNDAEATGRLTLDGALAFEGAMQTGRDPNGSVWAVVGIHDVWGGPGPAVTATFDNVLITSP